MSNEEKPFFIDKPKIGRASCKKCKEKCKSKELRIAKQVPNFFSEGGGSMKQWYHVNCIFESFKTQKATTKRIESTDDIEGWDKLTEDDRDEILEKIQEDGSVAPKAKKLKQSTLTKKDPETSNYTNDSFRKDSDDNSFSTFRSICNKIASESSYNKKSELLNTFFIKGTNGKKFEGDLYLWLKLLLPMANKRVYNLQSKQLVKLFSRIFGVSQPEMLTDLEQGDVSETIRIFFEKSSKVKPKFNNNLLMQNVDEFLEKLSKLTKEDEQIDAFATLCKMSDSNDLKMVIRLIKCDLKINAGPRHILDAINIQAYTAFQLSRDLKMVVDKFASTISQNKINNSPKNSDTKKDSGVKLMSPISPMLAEACKSVEKAILKNPDGMYSEIKYDGERVQIHKSGKEFRFFSRNLKPVMDHKVARCKEYIPKAFPSGQDMILDSEIIVVNTDTGELLPFGTLGVHKREKFENSEVCLFIFDCIYFNGEDLTKKTLKERKKILENEIKPIKHHVQLSEYYHIKTQKELATMTAKVLKAGLEGLVLKNIKSLYQPGKRGWLKIKKDYLFEGQMADTADLVVLGGWFGTGKKGGMLSIFLMGSYDPKQKLWKTVTKVHSGLDDDQMNELQKDFKNLMVRASSDKSPSWLMCKKQLIPDFLAIDPEAMPVWEITGAEFTKSDVHTANGISIRFPRITRIRDDKSPKEATNIHELELLYKNSKDNLNVDEIFKDLKDTKIGGIKIETKLYDGDRDSSDDNDNFSGQKLSSKIKIEETLKNEKDENYVKYKDNVDEFSKQIDVKIKTELYDGDKMCIDDQYDDGVKEEIGPSRKKIKVEKDIQSFEISGFSGINIYIREKARKKLDKKILENFLNKNGKIVKDSKIASHVIHSEQKYTEDLDNLRKKYDPHCRHLIYRWLEDSILKNTVIKDLPQYSIKL